MGVARTISSHYKINHIHHDHYFYFRLTTLLLLWVTEMLNFPPFIKKTHQSSHANCRRVFQGLRPALNPKATQKSVAEIFTITRLPSVMQLSIHCDSFF